jgi:hypothetical protein
MAAMGWIFGKNSWQGAQTTLHLAMRLSECRKKELNKKYFSDCREGKNYSEFQLNFIPKFYFIFIPETIFVSQEVGNREVEKKLWEATQDLLQIQF